MKHSFSKMFKINRNDYDDIMKNWLRFYGKENIRIITLQRHSSYFCQVIAENNVNGNYLSIVKDKYTYENPYYWVNVYV